MHNTTAIAANVAKLPELLRGGTVASWTSSRRHLRAAACQLAVPTGLPRSFDFSNLPVGLAIDVYHPFPYRPANPRARRGSVATDDDHQNRLSPNGAFGTRGSQVQILPPDRPIQLSAQQSLCRLRRSRGTSAHIPRVKLRCADPLQEFHLGERFLLWRFRRHSVRQPYRVSEETWFGNMTKSPTRELPPQTNEEPPPRHRNVYNYDGEYEFPSAQHWTAPDVLAPPRVMSALPPKADIG